MCSILHIEYRKRYTVYRIPVQSPLYSDPGWQPSENDWNRRSLPLTPISDQEQNDEPSVGPNEMKTNPEDKLLISDKGVTIMKCYQCCEEVELTDQILDRISGGMFSKMNKQASLNYRI